MKRGWQDGKNTCFFYWAFLPPTLRVLHGKCKSTSLTFPNVKCIEYEFQRESEAVPHPAVNYSFPASRAILSWCLPSVYSPRMCSNPCPGLLVLERILTWPLRGNLQGCYAHLYKQKGRIAGQRGPAGGQVLSSGW